MGYYYRSSDDDLPEGVMRRIIGLELNFTDNKFGDKDVQLIALLTRLVLVQLMEVLHVYL